MSYSDVDAFVSDPANVSVHDDGWIRLPSGAEVTRLPLWDTCAGRFARLGWAEAEAWLKARGMRLPTTAEQEELQRLPETMHIPILTMPTPDQLKAAGIPATVKDASGKRVENPAVRSFANPRMRSTAWCDLHDQTQLERMKARGRTNEPVVNVSKWQTSPAGTLSGMFFKSGELARIQHPRNPNAANFPPHGPAYTDYANLTYGARDTETVADPITPPDSVPPPTPTTKGDRDPMGVDGPVTRWQLYLIGYFATRGKDALPRYGADGDHGTETTTWTDRWARLENGEDDLDIVSVAPMAPNTLEPFDLLSLPFVQAANFTPVSERTIELIVFHDMEYPERMTAAEQVANWFGGKVGEPPEASAHLCIDADSAVKCLDWMSVGWHAPGCNHNGIGLEHAGYARQSRDQWLDEYSHAMLVLSARITAALCDLFDLPRELVEVDGLRAGDKGITSHRWASLAFRKSTHTDPGPDFPWDVYMDLVQRVRPL